MASQLTDLIRKKYPGQYDDLDDATLEKSILAKYPDYKDLAIPEPEIQKTEIMPEEEIKPKSFKGPWWNPIEVPEEKSSERADTAMFSIKPKQAETWWGGFGASVAEQMGEIFGAPEIVAGGIGTKLLRGNLPRIGKNIISKTPEELRDLENLAAVEKWAKEKPIKAPSNVADEAIVEHYEELVKD